ncbi:transcription factor NAI1-like [Neltuma alba]|uniref:transcription factor NAI1-like n=1 Tax=Neltuma alba TaxID=207710 RepID=UPI0010A35773|nr:transcription factor NAI1-like [Prosopis alba]
MDDGEDFHDQYNNMMMSFDEEDQEFLRDIMQQQPGLRNYPSSQTETENSGSSGGNNGSKDESRMMSPRSYILSFGNSDIKPINSNQEESNDHRSSKITRNVDPRKVKRKRSDTFDHIMAERRRRQRITDKFIALSATIPGLKKLDKATILDEAIKCVKQLQERVRELEKELSVISIKKIEVCENDEFCETNEVLPMIEVRVSDNQVLLGIHCEKQNGIEFKILSLLETFHLCVSSSSILPFGDSSLGITIVARVGDESRMRVNDVVKKLRQILSKLPEDDDCSY